MAPIQVPWLSVDSIPWQEVLSVFGAIGTALTIAEFSFRAGQKRGKPSREGFSLAIWKQLHTPKEPETQSSRLSTLLQELSKRQHQLSLQEGFPAIRKIRHQLWKIHAELERLEHWVALFIEDESGQIAILDQLEDGATRRVDSVFLCYIVESDEIFSLSIRGRCEKLLKARTGE